jgi:hypothetical protein
MLLSSKALPLLELAPSCNAEVAEASTGQSLSFS